MASYRFVIPRCGTNVVGGAETLCRELAEQLSARGDDVEIWSTCAKDNRTWANELPEGSASENGVTVRRFLVGPRDLEKWIPLQIQISEGMRPSIENQLVWMEHSVHSPDLCRWIVAHGHQCDFLLFAPYLFGTTFWGALLQPERSILIPCLHDERYAYLECIASMFRQVRGCLFNAAPERALAERLYGACRGGVVGMGFVPPSRESIESLEPYFAADRKYLLYVGRKETGKNAHLLIDYFVEAKDRGIIEDGWDLVIVGGGDFKDLHRPHALERADIVDVPHVTEREKQRIMRHALALCQPSVNESFGIVMMESWMVEVPVVVHARCAVTRHHVIESSGGLYFDSAEEFGAVVREIIRDRALGRKMGESGRIYVEREYSWRAVIDRFDATVASIAQPPLGLNAERDSPR